MTGLLFLKPQFKEKIWGGNKLKEQFGYEFSEENMGEVWGISAHPQGITVIDGGEFDGERLNVLWEKHPELFGNEDGRYGVQFPLLVKVIDAKEDLSIQVHPDDVYAKAHEHGSLGKTECWYVLDCEPDSTIVIGHQAKSHKEMEEMISQGRWKEFIREIPIKKGDFFQIAPGCVHAIKGGTLLLETQQSSDVTYRVYDYGRLSEGKPRPLHLARSMDVITVPWEQEDEERTAIVTENVDKEHLQTCDYYTVEHYRIHGTWDHYFCHGFTNVSVIEGSGTIDGIPVKKGMNFIVPAGHGACRLEGDFRVICSWPEPGIHVDTEQGGSVRRSGEDMICLEVLDWMGRRKAWAKDENRAVLAFEDFYEEGDCIRITVPKAAGHYVVQIDDAIEESMVYMTERKVTFEIPFGEKKKAWNPKTFTGRHHYLTCRLAEEYEMGAYRNLAKNTMDQHGDRGYFPHASTNVEYRGKSVFEARNAIDGIVANRSHGSWPYGSWGINKRKDAQFLLEFGRPVTFDRIILWIRADFPHDNWWVQAKMEFSDGTCETVLLKKTEKPQEFFLEKEHITWIRLKNLLQSDDPSPFPALTQIEVYGKEGDH